MNNADKPKFDTISRLKCTDCSPLTLSEEEEAEKKDAKIREAPPLMSPKLGELTIVIAASAADMASSSMYIYNM